jgi:hypothetical protein
MPKIMTPKTMTRKAKDAEELPQLAIRFSEQS